MSVRRPRQSKGWLLLVALLGVPGALWGQQDGASAQTAPEDSSDQGGQEGPICSARWTN